MTLLWIIIGATVGVLALAGIVVGSLAAAGVFRKKPAEEAEPALAQASRARAPEPKPKPEPAEPRARSAPAPTPHVGWFGSILSRTRRCGRRRRAVPRLASARQSTASGCADVNTPSCKNMSRTAVRRAKTRARAWAGGCAHGGRPALLKVYSSSLAWEFNITRCYVGVRQRRLDLCGCDRGNSVPLRAGPWTQTTARGTTPRPR